MTVLGKLEATKGQKVLQFSYFTMLLELEWFRGAEWQGEKRANVSGY